METRNATNSCVCTGGCLTKEYFSHFFGELAMAFRSRAGSQSKRAKVF